MTDTLLCIGGPCDGKRHESKIENSQTLILFENGERAIYTRESLDFGGNSVSFWVHEGISPMQALMKLMGYKGDAE